MSVYFKFKSSINYDSITVEGQYITVGNLKDKIIEKKRYSSSDCVLLIFDAQSGAELTDDRHQIPRNSSVVVKRMPSSYTGTKPAPAKASTAAAETSEPFPDEFGALYEPEKPPSLSAEAVEEAAKLADMVKQQSTDWQKQTSFTPGGVGRGRFTYSAGRGAGRVAYAGRSNVPPEGYICHRCAQPGHFIQHCPTNGDPNFDVRRMRPVSGIPRSRLQADEGGNMISRDGRVVKLRPDDTTFEREAEALRFLKTALNDPPAHLTCPIDKKLYEEAVLITCCSETFCDKCLRSQLSATGKCPGCQSGTVTIEDIRINKAVRAAVDQFRDTLALKAQEISANPQPLQAITSAPSVAVPKPAPLVPAPSPPAAAASAPSPPLKAMAVNAPASVPAAVTSTEVADIVQNVSASTGMATSAVVPITTGMAASVSATVTASASAPMTLLIAPGPANAAASAPFELSAVAPATLTASASVTLNGPTVGPPAQAQKAVDDVKDMSGSDQKSDVERIAEQIPPSPVLVSQSETKSVSPTLSLAQNADDKHSINPPKPEDTSSAAMDASKPAAEEGMDAGTPDTARPGHDAADAAAKDERLAPEGQQASSKELDPSSAEKVASQDREQVAPDIEDHKGAMADMRPPPRLGSRACELCGSFEHPPWECPTQHMPHQPYPYGAGAMYGQGYAMRYPYGGFGPPMGGGGGYWGPQFPAPGGMMPGGYGPAGPMMRQPGMYPPGPFRPMFGGGPPSRDFMGGPYLPGGRSHLASSDEPDDAEVVGKKRHDTGKERRRTHPLSPDQDAAGEDTEREPKEDVQGKHRSVAAVAPRKATRARGEAEDDDYVSGEERTRRRSVRSDRVDHKGETAVEERPRRRSESMATEERGKPRSSKTDWSESSRGDTRHSGRPDGSRDEVAADDRSKRHSARPDWRETSKGDMAGDDRTGKRHTGREERTDRLADLPTEDRSKRLPSRQEWPETKRAERPSVKSRLGPLPSKIEDLAAGGILQGGSHGAAAEVSSGDKGHKSKSKVAESEKHRKKSKSKRSKSRVSGDDGASDEEEELSKKDKYKKHRSGKEETGVSQPKGDSKKKILPPDEGEEDAYARSKRKQQYRDDILRSHKSPRGEAGRLASSEQEAARWEMEQESRLDLLKSGRKGRSRYE